MSFQCGIVGLPNVGKSTLFNALTQASVDAANYPFCTIEPNAAIVPVPDPRLDQLRQLVHAQQSVPTTVEFVDIAGLVAGAAKGEGLGNQFLSHIRKVDALIHVVRCFKDSDIVHVAGTIDPVADIKTIDTELILADLESAEKALHRTQRTAKTGNKSAIDQGKLLQQLIQQLNQGLPLRLLNWDKASRKQLEEWQFLTIKPLLYLANVAAESTEANAELTAVQQHAALEGAQVVSASVQLEAELQNLSESERQDLLELVGYQDTSLSRLIQAGYTLLGLQTFFTAGPQEVRAWTIPVGATAFDAAGCIHTDFQKGFIRAEVIAYEDFIQYQGEQGAKTAGKWRLEGKTSLIQEGDIVYFRFNI
jgi:ribosome-binding ATPase